MNIIGQEKIKNMFKELIKNDKLGHGYILSGPKGIGKRSLAYNLIKSILCSEKDASCNKCKSCMLFSDNSHPEFIKITTDTQSISVDQIRDMQKELSIRPLYSEKKVILIEDGDKMTTQAQNALLKSIEEPPSFICIIVTVSNYDKILTTIKSRTVRLIMENYTVTQIKEICESKDLKYLEFYNSYGGGNIGKVLEIANSEMLNTIRNDFINKFKEYMSNTKLYCMDFLNYLIELKENSNYVLDVLISVLRDVLVYKETENENLLINLDKKDMIIYIVGLIDKKKVIENINIVLESKEAIKKNANYQMTIDWLMVNMI